MSLIINPYAFGASFSGPFDSYTTDLVGAWSTSRRLLSSYTGALIRVRESGGSTEADIDPAGNGDLDQTALTTHTGANSGFLRYIYDQSGAAADFGQSTAADQPLIVDAGSVYNNIGAKPTAKFDSDGMTAAVTTAQARTIYIVARKRSAPAGSSVALFGSGGTFNAQVFTNSSVGTGYAYFSDLSNTVGTPANAGIVVANYSSNTSVTVRWNGTNNTAVDPDNGYYGTNVFCIGRDSAGTGAGDYDIAEMLAFSASHDESTMDAIEAIFASYYGITL